MNLQPRLIVFSLAGALAYTLAYYFNWPLFEYYLQDNSIFFLGQGAGEGPPILWYGWMATAIIAGAGAAALVPPKLAARIPGDLNWLFPCVLIFAALMYEKRWFM